MPPRRSKRLKGSTERSVDFLNNAGRTAPRTPSNTTGRHAPRSRDVYGLPSSEPEEAPRRNLRRSVSSPRSNEYTREEERGAASQSASGARSPSVAPSPIANEQDAWERSESEDDQQLSESHDDTDPTSQPVQLPGENEESDEDEAPASDRAATEDRYPSGEPLGADNPSSGSEQSSEYEVSVSDLLERSSLPRASWIHSSQPQEIAETPASAAHPSTANVNRPSHKIFEWFTETIKESGFKETWQVIRRGRDAKRYVIPAGTKRFRRIKRMRDCLEKLYERIAEEEEGPWKPEYVSSSKLIANNIYQEIKWVTTEDCQTNGTDGDAPAEQLEADAQVEQLEANVVPWLVELVLFGFWVYKTRGKPAAKCLRIVLDLLWGCGFAIQSYFFPDRWAYSTRFIINQLKPAVKSIKDALDDGRLDENNHKIMRRGKPPYRHFALEEVNNLVSCLPWQPAEHEALSRGFWLWKYKLGDVERMISLLSNESR